MFWNKKHKTNKHKKGKNRKAKSEECTLSKNKQSQSLAGDALRAQALANAKQARENLGEDTIKKIADIMAKKQNSPVEQAKRSIQNADSKRVTDEILFMLDDK